MVRRFNASPSVKKILIYLGAGIAGAVIGLVASGHFINPLARNLQFRISTANTIVPKDKFIKLEGKLNNNTLHPEGAPWDTCAQQIEYYIDNRSLGAPKGSGCAIGYGNILPGQTLTQSFILDPSDLRVGKHTIYILYGDIQSNTISFTIKEAGKINDCYKFTSYATPLCTQLQINSLVSSLDNSERCRLYFEYLKTTPLRPIPPLSSMTCKDSTYSVPYIVVNVPKGDPDHWSEKIAEHFNYVTMPDDYGTAHVATYPSPD